MPVLDSEPAVSQGIRIPSQILRQPTEQSEARFPGTAVFPSGRHFADPFTPDKGFGRQFQRDLEPMPAFDPKFPDELRIIKAEAVGGIVRRQAGQVMQ